MSAEKKPTSGAAVQYMRGPDVHVSTIDASNALVAAVKFYSESLRSLTLVSETSDALLRKSQHVELELREENRVLQESVNSLALEVRELRIACVRAVEGLNNLSPASVDRVVNHLKEAINR